MPRHAHSLMLVGLGVALWGVKSFGERRASSRWLSSMGHTQVPREQAFSQKLSAESERVEVSVLSRERRSRDRVCTTWRHQPSGVRLDLLMRVGRGITGDPDQGLFLQSGSSCVSSREPLTDSSPAGIPAVLSVIHYCRRCYVLTAAADGIAKEQGCLRDRRYILLPLSFPFLAGACVTLYLTKTGIIFSSVTRF